MSFGASDPDVGDRVRDRKWGGTHVGSLVGRDGDRVYVRWDGTEFTEDELDVREVERE